MHLLAVIILTEVWFFRVKGDGGARKEMKVVLPVQEQREFVACIDEVERRVSRAILCGVDGAENTLLS